MIELREINRNKQSLTLTSKTAQRQVYLISVVNAHVCVSSYGTKLEQHTARRNTEINSKNASNSIRRLELQNIYIQLKYPRQQKFALYKVNL